MPDKLTNPVTTHLDDALYRFVKLKALSDGTDISAVMRFALDQLYNNQMREVKIFQSMLEDQR